MIRDFSQINNILSLVFTLLLFVLFDFILFLLIKRKFPRIFTIVIEVVILISWLFCIDFLFYISLALFVIGIVVTSFANMNEIRRFTANVLKGKSSFDLFHKKEKIKPEVMYNREDVYKKVENAIRILSKQKIGALVTFEKNDDLSEIMKNGTILNAPVSSELIQTIFYPGTRLHDGAVIIRGDKIAAASVYFTPTNRPLTGKYGSRHRAAYGISETTDSVTIVVSEETGRISIAFQGEITPTSPDDFLRIFEEDMATTVTKDEE